MKQNSLCSEEQKSIVIVDLSVAQILKTILLRRMQKNSSIRNNIKTYYSLQPITNTLIMHCDDLQYIVGNRNQKTHNISM